MKLLHGDCLELLQNIPEKSIDMILTDPPYGTTACKWDSVIPFDRMWEQLNRIIKDNGAIVLFGSEPFSSALCMSNVKNFKYNWIWDKRNSSTGLMAKKRPLKQHEIISVFNTKYYYPQMEKTEKRADKPRHINNGECFGGKESYRQYNNNGVKYPKSILYSFSNANQNNKLHPTQKPVALLEYLIKTYTLENETVLDFTMGSGSTGVACVNTNRDFIGIELDDKYFYIAKDRIETAQKEVQNVVA